MAKTRQRGNGQGTLFKRNGEGCWIAKWYDHKGKRHERSMKTTDKTSARRIIDKIIADEALRREGVIDPDQDAFAIERRRPISEHVDEFRTDLEGKRSSSHVATQLGRIEKIIEVGDVATWADISPDCIERALLKIEEDRGISLQTRNKYLTAFKGFCNWIVNRKRAARNPIQNLDHVEVSNTEHRRALQPEEFQRLLAAAESARPMRGLTRQGRSLERKGEDIPAEQVVGI